MLPDIVLGPPGTGKTTRLLEEVDRELAAGRRPDRVGFLSFTRRATEEAVTRACQKFRREREDFPHFRTLHSLCFRQLGLSSAEVMEGRRAQEFAEYAGIVITGRVSEDGTLSRLSPGDRIMFTENLARMRGVPLRQQYDEMSSEIDQIPAWNEVSRVARALADFKRERGLSDYTDMLLDFVRLGNRPRLEVLLVDEGQDLSWAQWQVIRFLAQGCERVVVAGDDDQGIYRWAGADVDFFVDLRGRPTVLDQSWRVPRAVQRLAASPLGAVLRRRAKEWRPRDEEGEVLRVGAFEHADAGGQDVMVLARNDYVLREQVEPALRREGVIYEKNGHPSVRRAVLDAVVAWERLRAGRPVTGDEARRVYSVMSAGVGYARGNRELKWLGDEELVTAQDLRERGGLLTDKIWHEALDRVSSEDRVYLVAARRRGERLLARPRVRVSTIHGSKGGQADHVILLTEMAARTHAEMRVNPDDEARVWYVGATRARERLTVVSSRTHRRCPWL